MSTHLPTILLLLFTISSSTTINITNLCSTFPALSTLPPSRLTVLIPSFHPSRAPLLRNLTLLYTSLPSVASIVILHPSTSPPSPPLPHHPLLHLLPLPSQSLNLRFLPLPAPLLRSRSVLVSDDDVLPHPASLSLALSLSPRHPLLGFFPRSHSLSLTSNSWLYAFHPRRHSIVLAKLMVVRADYLYKYSCWDRLQRAREVVERERNCEDVLMSFVGAMETGEGPTVVDGRVRDFGDLRNEGEEGGRVGLSARKEHWERRGWCITEFHRILGVMPLRYGYGKVVGVAGEQGVCSKGGKLVLCDQNV